MTHPHTPTKMALSEYQRFPTPLALLILAFEVNFTLLSLIVTTYIFITFYNHPGALEPFVSSSSVPFSKNKTLTLSIVHS